MSMLATVSLVWAGVYAYSAAFYVLIWMRRRADREFLAFGVVCVGAGLYALGSALVVEAESAAECARASSVGWAGGALIVASFTDFTASLVGDKGRRWVRAAYIFVASGLVLDAAGLFFDPSATPPEQTWGFASVDTLHLVSPTPLGYVYLNVSFIFVVYNTYRLARASRKDRDALLMLVTSALWTVAGMQDSMVSTGGLRSIFLVPHVAVLTTVAVGWILLGRFERAGEELAERTAELSRSVIDLRAAQEELLRKEQLATVGELSAVIAHEVRNPIAIIKNAVSGLRRGTLADGDRAVLLGILDEEAERLNRLVGDLLAFARPLAPQSREVKLDDLVERALELARKASPASANVSLDVSLDGGPMTVHCDPDLFRQAVVNVAENAFQAMPGGGTLTVRAAHAQIGDTEAVSVRIADTGEGMDTLVRQKARDPFFTTRPAGTGLGLAIVDRVLRAHGGRVEIESSHGAGTTVALILPARQPSLNPPPPGQ